MSSSTLFRLSGAALIVGGALGAVGQLIHPADPEGPAMLASYAQASQPIHLLLFFAVLLVLLGLPGVYARQSDQTGLLGLVGFLLLFFGVPLVDLIHSVVDFAILPALVEQAPDQAMPVITAAFEEPSWAILQMLGFPLLGLGVVVFGIVTIRARVFPRWTGWLLVAVPIVGIISRFLPIPPEVGTSPDGVLFYVALVGFGYALLAGRRAVGRPTPEPPTARPVG
jgi:hypothetical protein